MDQDLRDAFATLHGAVSDLRTDVTRRFETVERQHADLRRDIFGSSQPPMANGSASIPLAKISSSASLEAEAATARLIVVEGKVDGLTKSNEVQLAILTRLDTVAKNPTVKLLVYAAGIVVAGWLASKGLK